MKNNDKKQSVEEKDCTNCTDEYHCDWLAAGDGTFCGNWSPDIDYMWRNRQDGERRI